MPVHLGNLSCCIGSTCLRKEGRPFLSGNGEESFSTTFAHPTKQLFSRLPISASGASSCPLLGAMLCCYFLPWDAMYQDADSGEFPLSAFALLIIVALQTVPHWIPFPLLQIVSLSFWHVLLTSYGSLKQNGRRETTIG